MRSQQNARHDTRTQTTQTRNKHSNTCIHSAGEQRTVTQHSRARARNAEAAFLSAYTSPPYTETSVQHKHIPVARALPRSAKQIPSINVCYEILIDSMLRIIIGYVARERTRARTPCPEMCHPTITRNAAPIVFACKESVQTVAAAAALARDTGVTWPDRAQINFCASSTMSLRKTNAQHIFSARHITCALHRNVLS